MLQTPVAVAATGRLPRQAIDRIGERAAWLRAPPIRVQLQSLLTAIIEAAATIAFALPACWKARASGWTRRRVRVAAGWQRSAAVTLRDALPTAGRASSGRARGLAVGMLERSASPRCWCCARAASRPPNARYSGRRCAGPRPVQRRRHADRAGAGACRRSSRVLMGVVTAVFGGVLRDVVCNEIPSAFADHRPRARRMRLRRRLAVLVGALAAGLLQGSALLVVSGPGTATAARRDAGPAHRLAAAARSSGEEPRG